MLHVHVHAECLWPCGMPSIERVYAACHFVWKSWRNRYFLLIRFCKISPKFRRNKSLFCHFVPAKFRFSDIFHFGGNPSSIFINTPWCALCRQLYRGNWNEKCSQIEKDDSASRSSSKWCFVFGLQELEKRYSLGEDGSLAKLCKEKLNWRLPGRQVTGARNRGRGLWTSCLIFGHLKTRFTNKMSRFKIEDGKKNVDGQNVKYDQRSWEKMLNSKNVERAKRRMVNNDERTYERR